MYYIMQTILEKYHKVRWQNFALVYLLIINMAVGILPTRQTRAVNTCTDVEFIFARGSGEGLSEPTYVKGDNGTNYAAWRTEITNSLQGSTLEYDFYELGTKSYQGYQYPAVAVSNDFIGYINLLGAAISGGEAFNFGKSVNAGATELKLHIAEVSNQCPNTKFVLSGYSQGAMLISKSLKDLDANKIIYAATFGDPKLYLPEGDTGSSLKPRMPDACRGVNLSNYRIFVPDCYAYAGVLGALIPYQDERYIDKLGTWCNRSDIMCSSGMSVNDHISYVSDNLYRDAAQKIYQKLQKVFVDKVPASKNNLHDVLFLFDATGSMQPTIDKYKAEAKKLAEKILLNNGRVALHTYKEWNGESTTVERCGFGCSIERLEKAIRGIYPIGGGDEDEGLLAALDNAMRKVSWTQGATKSIVVLTDAGFHDPDHGNITIADIVKLSLSIDPVNIYVIAPEKLSEKFEELTRLTGGEFFDVNSDREIALSTDVIYERPVALLNSPNFEGVINDKIWFDASGSYSARSNKLMFDWDLDGDGDFELKNKSDKVGQVYKSEGERLIQVRVTDEYGGSSTMSAQVKIRKDLPKTSKINQIEVKYLPDYTVRVDFNTDSEEVLILLDEMPMGFIDVENQQGYFVLKNIEQDLTLTMVPYFQEYRGEGSQIGVTKQQTNPEDVTPDNTKDESKDNNGEGSITILPNTKAESFGQQIDVIIPKVPDTGSYDAKLANRILRK